MPLPTVPSVEWFHINHVATATRALICLVTLTFDLLTMKLGYILANGMGNVPTNFGVYWDFSFLTYGPTPVRRTTWYRDLDLWPCACWWYGSYSLYSICVPSLNFVSLPIQKMWCIFGMVTFWPSNWCKLVHFTAHGVGNLATKAETFHSQLSDAPCDERLKFVGLLVWRIWYTFDRH